MPAYGFGPEAKWAVVTNIATGTGTTTLLASHGVGKQIVVQGLLVVITTTAAQAFDIEDSAGTVELFKAPASLGAGAYPVDAGVLGKFLTTNTGLVYTATAGVGLTISAFGYYVGS
jgi:hypothetical protein